MAWLGMAATQLKPEAYRRFRYRVVERDPIMVLALERRDALAVGAAHLEAGAVRDHVEAMLRRIDEDLLPELETRARRHRDLTRALGQLEQGRGPLVGASPDRIAALQSLADEQRKALDGLVARLSDLNANVMGLANEAQQSQFAAETGSGPSSSTPTGRRPRKSSARTPSRRGLTQSASRNVGGKGPPISGWA